MGSPAIFAGLRTKLLSADGLLLRNGMVLDNEGQKNYIFNGHGEISASGWATYADAAGSSPVDGTGGSPTSTFTRTTSSPLRGQGSLLFTKDAANRQGEGASYDFTIDDADKAKVLQIEADYEIASGTYATGDLALYIYDVTNAVVIQPAGYQIENVGIESRLVATFQTASNSTSYRLCFHVASTSASAYTVKFDNVKVGPQVTTQGSVETDWISASFHTTSLGGFGTVTGTSMFYKRVGDTAIVRGAFTAGTVSAAVGIVPRPAGLSLDTTKLGTGRFVVGHAANQGASGAPFNVFYNSSSGNLQWGIGLAGTGGLLDDINVSAYYGSNTTVAFQYIVPISGWGSQSVVSASANTRVTAARASGSDTSIASGSGTKVTFSNITFDTHAGFASNTYTVKVPGYYSVRGYVRWVAFSSWAAGNVTELYVYRNGVSVGILDRRVLQSSVTTNWGLGGSDLIRCNAGDTLELYVYQDNGSSRTLDYATFVVEMVNGPSQIAASEVITARYQTDAGQSGITSGAIINYEDRVDDTHGAVATGASWKFTAPIAGRYRVTAMNESTARADTVGNFMSLRLHKNGAPVSYIGLAYVQTASSILKVATGSDTISLNAGDYIDLRLEHNLSAGSVTLNWNPNTNYVCIERIGGVE